MRNNSSPSEYPSNNGNRNAKKKMDLIAQNMSRMMNERGNNLTAAELIACMRNESAAYRDQPGEAYAEESSDEDSASVLSSSNMNNKNSGDSYYITADFNFCGTLKEFEENPDATKLTLKDPTRGDGKHIFTGVDVEYVQNTFPFPVSFFLRGVPKSNIHVSQNHPDSVLTIPSRCVNPMRIKRNIYDAFAAAAAGDSFDIDHMDFKYHDVTDADICASFEIPEDMENIATMLAQTNKVFVKKDSVVMNYMRDNMGNPQKMIGECIPEIHEGYELLNNDEVQEYVDDLKDTVDNSPFGRLDNVTGSVSRYDKKSWDSEIRGLNQADLHDARNCRQEISVSLRITCEAAKPDSPVENPQ